MRIQGEVGDRLVAVQGDDIWHVQFRSQPDKEDFLVVHTSRR